MCTFGKKRNKLFDQFNIYSQHIMRRALERWEGGVTVGGKLINNLRYRDDTTLVAKNKNELIEVLLRIKRESCSFQL